MARRVCRGHLGPLVAIALLVATVACAQNQSKFSVQFEGTPLSKVLEAFKRFDPNFAYTLPPGAESKSITAALVDVNVDEALSIVLEQVNLRYVKDNNVYTIRERPEARTTRVDRPMPQYGAPIFATRPAAPAAAAGAPVATGDAPGDAGAAGADPRANLPIRLLGVKYANPALLAELFGGYTIYGDETSMMGGGGGRSGGGIGGGRGGSSRGGMGGGRGGSRGGIGGSRGGSSRGGSSRGRSSGRSRR